MTDATVARTPLYLGAILAAAPMAPLGCSDSSRAFIELPQANGISSVVVVWTGADPSVRAFEYGDVDPVELEPSEDAWVLMYPETLAELRISSGPLSADPDARSCRLLDPEVVYQLVSGSASEFGFAQVSPDPSSILPEDAIELLLGRGAAGPCQRCPEFEIDVVSTSERLRATAGTLLPTGEVLLQAAAQPFLASTSEVRALDCGVRFREATTLRDGRVWAALGGDSWVLEVDRQRLSCARGQTWPSPLPSEDESYQMGFIRGLDPGPDSSVDVWALTGRGRLFTLSSTTWTERGQLELHPVDATEPDPSARATSSADLARLGPNHIAANVGNDYVAFVEDGVLDIERLPTPSALDPQSNRVTAIAYLEARPRRPARMLAGGRRGQVYERRRGEWNPVPGTPLEDVEDEVGGFIRTDQGYLFTVRGGRVGFVHPERGACPEPLEISGAQGEGTSLFRREDGRIAIVDYVGERDEQDLGVVWLTPSER